MIDRASARLTVEELINQSDPTWPSRPRAVVLDDAVIELQYGWVFFWEIPGEVVAGNAPLLVTKHEGKVLWLGTSRPIEDYLAAFEQTGDPHSTTRAT